MYSTLAHAHTFTAHFFCHAFLLGLKACPHYTSIHIGCGLNLVWECPHLMLIVHKWIGWLNLPGEVDWIQIQGDPDSLHIQWGQALRPGDYSDALPDAVTVCHVIVHVFCMLGVITYLRDSIWSLLGSVMSSGSTVSIVVCTWWCHTFICLSQTRAWF